MLHAIREGHQHAIREGHQHAIAYLHVLIGDDWNPLVEHRHDHLHAIIGEAHQHAIREGMQSEAIRRNYLLADQMLVTRIGRVHAHSGIAQDRLRSCRGHSHVGFGARLGEHVLKVVELACE